MLPLLLEPASLVVTPTPESEPNDTPATANVLTLVATGQVVSGSITPAGDFDYFSFTVPANSLLWARVDTFASNTDTDSILTLLRPRRNDRARDRRRRRTRERLRHDGREPVLLRHRRSPSHHRRDVLPPRSGLRSRLHHHAVHARGRRDDRSHPGVRIEQHGRTANPIVTAGSPVGVRTAEINPLGDVDYYSVVAGAGSSLYISADGDPERNVTGTDIVIDVIAPDGRRF